MSFVDFLFFDTENNIGFWNLVALMQPQRIKLTSCFAK